MPQDNKKVIVIGAGLGGLSCAISLAQDGHSVTIYEKRDRIGGKLNIREIEGFNFDLGPSILILPHIFERLFTGSGEKMSDHFSITRLEPQWRNFFEDDTVVDLWGDIARMEEELSRFPEEETDGYYEYIEYSRRLWNFAREAYFGRGADTMADVSRGYGKLKLLGQTDYFFTMAEKVRRYIKNPYLRDIMCFFIKYIGSSPFNAPAIFNLLPYSQLGYGEWYVEGGMYNIARGLGHLLEKEKVEVNLDSEVVRIVAHDGEARGVELASGEIINADIVVSNMETVPAYRELLEVESDWLEEFEHRFEPSCSGLVVHLGVDREYPNLAHHNFFFAEDLEDHMNSVYNEYKMPTYPTIYVVAPTRTDKSIAPKGCEVIKLLPHIPHLQEPPFSREEYDALKERLYDKLERNGVENLREHIVVEDILYPEDIRDMYYSNRGSIYGVVADKWKNKGFRAPKRSELVQNLYFVGGSVNPGSGMPMVAYSGQMVRDMIAEKISEESEGRDS